MNRDDATSVKQGELETRPAYVASAEQDAARARARFASNVKRVSRSGRVIVKRAIHEARPFLMGAMVVAGMGAALLIRALIRPARRASLARRSPWVVERPSFGQRLAQVLVSAIASAALRRLAAYAAARMDASPPQLGSGDLRAAREGTHGS